MTATFQAKSQFIQMHANIVPYKWRLVTISEIAATKENAIVGGPFGSDLVSNDYVPYGIPVIRGQNMSGRFVAGDFVFVSEKKAKTLKANTAVPQDIVFTQRGTLGQVALVPNNGFDIYLVSQSQMKLTPDPQKCDPRFLLQYFKSSFGQRQIIDSAIQTGVPHTNLGILKNYKIPLPALSEQRAIADTLDEADQLIETLESLVAKKRALKQGVMDELLSGQRRLPGFDAPWQTRKLGDLGLFLKGSGIRKDQAQSGLLPCVRYGEIYTDHHDVLRHFRSSISREVAAGATPIRKGDILFAGSGETKEEIGKCVALATDIQAYAGGDIVILRTTSGCDPTFLGYALNTPAIQARKSSRGQGDAVVHISATALASIDVFMPEAAEQSAIASILSDFDADLKLLVTRVEKARQLKQGMIQQLLTGGFGSYENFYYS